MKRCRSPKPPNGINLKDCRGLFFPSYQMISFRHTFHFLQADAIDRRTAVNGSAMLAFTRAAMPVIRLHLRVCKPPRRR